MKEKKGCGCSERTVIAKQQINELKKASKPINKIYKTRTNIFN
jgi:hypothetical protein